MKPVDQKHLHDPPETIGDCFVACCASIVEWPIERVPDFREGMYHPDGQHRLAASWNNDNVWWWTMFLHWIDIGGFEFGVMYPNRAYTFDWSDKYVIASGPSPRFDSETHAVIWRGGRNGEVVHDPHPSRDGLELDSIHDILEWMYIGFQPLVEQTGDKHT